MAWKFSSNASMYTPFTISYYVHGHLDGGGWYMDLPTWLIPYSKLELYQICQAFALQLPIGIPIDLPIVELCESEQTTQIVNEQVVMVSQATKVKAKGGKKRNKVANKVTLKAFGRSNYFCSTFTNWPSTCRPTTTHTSCWHVSTRSPICCSPTSIPW
jgi:hypothetical protein